MAGRAIKVLVGAACVVLLCEIPALAAPAASLNSEQKASAAYAQGVARVKGGWILTGRFIISRVDEKLREKKTNRRPIPSDLARQGYNHVGDIDVAGKYIYVPLEQGNYDKGLQITARYSLKTLKYVDSVELAQHENSFVTVDPKTMIAYSFDHFGGQALLRYDVRKDWAPLPPIPMSAFVDKVQGADVSGGFAWLSTSNPTNELYRVDLKTGEVVDLGSAGHVPGEGEGIDATKLTSGRIHSLVVDPKINPVWFGHFAVSE
jgi:hypothetical protein